MIRCGGDGKCSKCQKSNSDGGVRQNLIFWCASCAHIWADGECIFQLGRGFMEKLFNGINWYKCSFKLHTKRADRSESTLPKEESYQAPWKRGDLFEECTQKKLISVEQQWRLVGGNAWARGNRIKAWKSSWLFQLKFMNHCFTLNCTRGGNWGRTFPARRMNKKLLGSFVSWVTFEWNFVDKNRQNFLFLLIKFYLFW